MACLLGCSDIVVGLVFLDSLIWAFLSVRAFRISSRCTSVKSQSDIFPGNGLPSGKTFRIRSAYSCTASSDTVCFIIFCRSVLLCRELAEMFVVGISGEGTHRPERSVRLFIRVTHGCFTALSSCLRRNDMKDNRSRASLSEIGQ